MPFGPSRAHGANDTPEKPEQISQQKLSWSRQIGRLRRQPWFLWIMNRVSAGIFGAVMFWAGATFNQDTAARHFRIVFHNEIQKTQAATVQNRCIGFTILSHLGEGPPPPWCKGVINELRNEPAVEPPPLPEKP